MSLNKTDYELFEKYGYDKDDRRIIIAWLERIREDNNHKGESKPFPNRNNDAHIVALKNILLEKGFDQKLADKITLILEKGKDDDYVQLAFNSYALKTDLPSGWKKGDKVPDGIQKYSKDDKGNYNPIGGDDKKQGDEPPEVKPEKNPNFNDDNIDGDHLTSKKKKSKKDNKTEMAARRARYALSIPKVKIIDPQKEKDLTSMLKKVNDGLDKLNDEEKQSVRNTIMAIQTLFAQGTTDEQKEEAWRNINVTVSPNREKLYLDDLRGSSGLYKILGQTEATKRLVNEVSQYKDLPEDDNKVYQKLEALAKPDIGGGEGARTMYKMKSKKYTDEVADPKVAKLFATEPLNRITKAAFRSVFGPVDEQGHLKIPSSDHSREYLIHSITNNVSVEKTAEFLEELARDGKTKPELAQSIRSHQQRMRDILKNEEIPSEDARKAVQESYTVMAEELHETDGAMAGRMLKQFAEMEQYDSEIAGGDETYLPGHGSFPGGDKLLFEKGNAGAKKVAFISIKYGKGGTKKRVVYGFPANMSALQQIHPNENKRESLGQYTGQPGFALGVNDNLIKDSKTATNTIITLLDEMQMGDLFTPKEKTELGNLASKAKKRIENVKKQAQGSDGKIDWGEFNRLRENDSAMIRINTKLRKICSEDKLAKLIGPKNAEPYAKRLTPEIFLGSVIGTNQIKTANGYDFLKHNKQYMEDGEYKDETIDGSTDMNDWFFHMRFKRTPGRNGGGFQASCVSAQSRDEIQITDSNSDNIN
tara:strand:- start:264 stop:2543 length:2280 start_codon:yes stop_codon:yes gene_type:complete